MTTHDSTPSHHDQAYHVRLGVGWVNTVLQYFAKLHFCDIYVRIVPQECIRIS